jgi:hypothetical protein
MRHKSADEALYKGGRGRHGDQVDGPGAVASAYEVEMSRAAFVSVCVKAHDRGPFCTVRGIQNRRLLNGSSDR